jgi:mycothione reductase
MLRAIAAPSLGPTRFVRTLGDGTHDKRDAYDVSAACIYIPNDTRRGIAMEHFDLIILGAGSGNSFVGPEHDHLKIAMVERNLFGGTCLNVGCIPTKMFTHTADVAYQADHSAPLGLDIALEKVRWTDIRDRIFGRIDPIPPKGKHYREHLDNWTVFDGTARFVGPKTVEVLGADGSTTISGDQIVIATGASAVIPHGSGFSDVPYETSDTVVRGRDHHHDAG